jgi:hypothetical protein
LLLPLAPLHECFRRPGLDALRPLDVVQSFPKLKRKFDKCSSIGEPAKRPALHLASDDFAIVIREAGLSHIHLLSVHEQILFDVLFQFRPRQTIQIAAHTVIERWIRFELIGFKDLAPPRNVIWRPPPQV